MVNEGTTNPQAAEIYAILSKVCDPEIPVLTLEDMGIIRDVIPSKDWVEVIITPTYSGCPAMNTIEEDIIKALNEAGFTKNKVTTVLDPPWTTEWMTLEGKKKLEEYGIAPPRSGTADKRTLFGKTPVVKCPRCKSENTEVVSMFGSTACKALYKCLDCQEPFDYFKCI